MTQQSLFDISDAPPQYDNAPSPPSPEERSVARARNTDPESSHEAAESFEKVAAGQQRQQVIDAVYKWPGKTSKELAALDGELDRVQFARRLPECEDMGEIHRVKEGRKELRWFPGSNS